MKFRVGLLAIFLFTIRLHGQLHNAVDSLQFFGDAMFSLKVHSNRAFAESQFLELAKRLIVDVKDSSLLNFHPSFISTQSFDKNIKIVSWQVESDDYQYHYYAYFFTPASKPVLIKSVSRNLERMNYETLNSENWYGALYYRFIPGNIEGYYTILGYRFSTQGFKYRIIDFIRMKDKKPEFGAPLIRLDSTQNNEDRLYRKVIAYSPSANASINYDETDKIIYFDHIVLMTDPRTGEIMKVPDGTFESMEWKNDFWQYNSYHKLQQVDSPPREKPVLDKRKKDLFGRGN